MTWRGWTRLICVAIPLWMFMVLAPVSPGPNPNPNPNPTPTPVPNPDWPAPPADLQAAMAPVRSVMLAANDQQAAAWAEAWEGYYTSMMDRTPLAGTAAFKSEISTAMNDAAVQLSLAGAFPGFTAAMDGAFASYFGSEDGPLDWNKGKAFVSAVVWACK